MPQINNLVIELSLLYKRSFVASTSDFWHHPSWKTSFAGVIANMMCPAYHFRNGMFLVVSNTTMKKLIRRGLSKELLESTTPTTHRVQALLHFGIFEKAKSGVNIGEMLEEVHSNVGIKPEFIGSHTVDGASNAGASVDTLVWNTEQERSQKIHFDNCDAHKINTTSAQASGSSKHVDNMNPVMGEALKILHNEITRMCQYKATKDVYANVKRDHQREKSPRLRPSVVTRWNSSYDETQSANANQYDLQVAIERIKAPGGVEETLRSDEEVVEVAAGPISEQWNMYAQYEGAMEPMKIYSTFSQSETVIAHEELYFGRMTLESLSAPFFVMYDNISKKTGSRGAKDLTVS